MVYSKKLKNNITENRKINFKILKLHKKVQMSKKNQKYNRKLKKFELRGSGED